MLHNDRKFEIKKPLRWVIVGCGSISFNFVQALGIADRNHHITLLVSTSIEKADDFKHKLLLSRNVKTYDNYEVALNLINEYDIVYIGIHASKHAEVINYALDKNRHVLCERPLAIDAEQVRQIINKARQCKSFLMEGYWSRFFPSWQKLRANLHELGPIHLVQANLCINHKNEKIRSRSVSPALFMSLRNNPNSTSILCGNQDNQTSNCFYHHIDDKNEHIIINGVNQCSVDSNKDSSNSLAIPFTPPTFLSMKTLLSNSIGGLLYSGAGYTINFALWVFDSEMPERITATGRIDENGNDVWGSITLEFNGDRIANLFYSSSQGSFSPALVVGNNGTFTLPERFWCSTDLVEEYGNPRGVERKQIHKFPIKKNSKGFQYPNGNAFYLEADHVYDAIAQGKTESDIMPLDDSLKIAIIIDEIRKTIISNSIE